MDSTEIFWVADDNMEIERFKVAENLDMSSPHAHSCYELFYLISGARRFDIDGVQYNLESGDLIFIKPHSQHASSTISRHKSYEKIQIYLEKHFVDHYLPAREDFDIDDLFHTTVKIKLGKREQWLLEQSVHKITAELMEKQRGYRSRLGAVILDLLILMSRYMDTRRDSEDRIKPRNPLMGEIQHFIETHYMEKLTLERISDRFGINKYHLSRAFKKHVGYSMIQYLTLMRITEAQKLLKETDLKLVDVAAMAGYESYSSFERAFKSLTGQAPNKYRKLNSYGYPNFDQ